MKVKTTKSVLLLITLLFSATIVAQSFEFDGYTYELQSDQTLTVKGYVNNSITEIKIPDTVEFEGRSYPVTTIGETAFGGFGNLKDAVLTINKTLI